MKHGIYYAYWETEWAADYVPYIKKVAKLGFDILEIGGAALPGMSDAQLKELKTVADDCGITITPFPVLARWQFERRVGSSIIAGILKST